MVKRSKSDSGLLHQAQAVLRAAQDDPTLEIVPTFGCIYCGRNTGCYSCRGHGVLADDIDGATKEILHTCADCLSACTACASLRNLLLELTGSRTS